MSPRFPTADPEEFMPFARPFRGAGRLALVSLAGFVSGALLAGQAQASGPWTPRDNTWNAEIRIAGLSTHEYYDVNGDKQTFPNEAKYRDWTALMSAEYGLANRWALALALPLRFLQASSPNVGFEDFNNGFGDAFIGVRYGALAGDKGVVSAQLEGILPTGYNAEGNGRPPLGEGISRLGGRVLAGYSLAPTPAYGQVELGYHGGNEEWASEMVGSAEVGAWPTNRVLVFADAQWNKNRDDEKRFEDFTRASVNLEYQLKNAFHVSAGVGSELSGKSHPAGTSLRVGVAWKGVTASDPYRGRLSRPDAKKPAPKPVPVPVPAPVTAPADSTQAPDSTKTGP
jgi:hypothetical protein